MSTSSRVDRVLGSLIGLTGFFVVVNPRVLNPADVRWLLWGDSATHYLGWEFFRKTPLVQWPIGANPHFGQGFGESIVYSDSIPLVAIPLKYFSIFLPDTFQYLGWWILSSFMLQGVMAFALIRLTGVSRPRAGIGTSVLVLFPPFLYRLTHEGYGHIALASHWLILYSMLMFVSGELRASRWTLASTVGLLVQPYLAVFPITLGVWRIVRDRPEPLCIRIAATLPKLLVLIGIPLSIFWAVGGFPSGSLRDSGFGVYQSTLTSLWDPAPTASFSWSRILRAMNFDYPAGTNEGFSFLGTGLVLLSPIAVALLLRRRRFPPGDWRGLLTVGVSLAVIALLPSVRLGGRTLLTVSVPDRILELAGIFRSNGRFMWLLAYTIAVLIFAIVASLPRRVPFLVLGLGSLVIGIVDGASALREMRERFSDSADLLIGERHAPTWNRIVKGRKHLITIPPLNNDPQWIDMAVLAKDNGMTTTAAYLGRVNESRFRAVLKHGEDTARRRNFRSDTVYVIMNYPPHPLAESLEREGSRASLGSTFRAEQIENLLVIYTD